MNVLVTGGAGFIGSHLTDALIISGHCVVVYDNLSTGRVEFIHHHLGHKGFRFIQGDVLDVHKLTGALEGIDFVYHLAANSDIRVGTTDMQFDLEQNTIATHNVLEAMRLTGIQHFVFTSSSVVYGEASVFPTPETYGPLIPISLYGASKLGAEGLISAYTNICGFKAWIFRFANIVGSRQTHGVLVDFIHKLQKNPKRLEILGNGKQKKSYLLVDDCVNAMQFCIEHAKDPVNILNLGSKDQISVTHIAELLLEELRLTDTKITYTGGKRGWAGDVPEMLLDTQKLTDLGWTTRYGSEDAIRITCRALMEELVS